MTKELKLVIDNNVLDKYSEYYFQKHPKAKNKPIENPYHPSTNQWMILKRPIMNSLKQRWKDFIVWFINDLGYQDLKINSCEVEVCTYRKVNRAFDLDNTTIKFIQDGFVEAGLLIDDNYKVLHKLTLTGGIDKNNPRTEIIIKYK
jgi:hypothetical protein